MATKTEEFLAASAAVRWMRKKLLGAAIDTFRANRRRAPPRKRKGESNNGGEIYGEVEVVDW